jgi:hypothetical protein
VESKLANEKFVAGAPEKYWQTRKQKQVMLAKSLRLS